MKFVALVSGGKDSIYSICKLLDEGDILVGIIYMNSTEEYSDSYMYQTVGAEAIDSIANCLNTRLFRFDTKCKTINKDLNYTSAAGDEVEDLYNAIEHVLSVTSFDAICSGAILSTYQKNRVEDVCTRLNLTSIAPLWMRDQKELLKEMIDYGMDARIVKIASPALPQKCLNMSLAEIYEFFESSKYPYGFNYCGEGGEFETIVFNCKHFNRGLVAGETETNCHPDEKGRQGDVFYLRLKDLR